MTLGFSAFASSSSGNCYYIKSETTHLLVDVGISASRIVSALETLGEKPSKISAVFLTHEHVDHVKSVSAFHKKAPEAWFIASEGTAAGLEPKAADAIAEKLVTISPENCDLMVGDILVHSFPLSHDAAQPTAYTFEKDGKKIAIVTDTGCVTEEVYDAMKDADLLVLEANHEENILLYGRYPYPVKRRILSDVGHLSNETAGRCLVRLLREPDRCKVPRVFLAHLSRENNTPQQAFLTVRNVLEEADYYIGKDLYMDVLGPEQTPILTEV